ncbi:MAG: glycerol-3-phosphate 1-O-acyltransferase PlsY [Synechococcus sp. WH 8007]|nr:glycerol-3-phosphate 1-O-acyltransferase PlsY [Synechococcus sp. WH 8007]
MTPLFTLVLAYLLGSFPSGYLAGRWLKGVDIRTLGSGSTGATNVLRQIGKGPALVVFLIDVLKGTAAVLLAKALGFNDWWVVAAGLAALAGHIWPIWLGWRGGKAVATGLGMLLGLAWPVGLACFGVFLTVISVSRIVSLSSVLGALSLPLLMLARFSSLGEPVRPAYLSLSIVAAVLVIWRHRSNLSRIAAGTEPRLGDKKKEA